MHIGRYRFLVVVGCCKMQLKALQHQPRSGHDDQNNQLVVAKHPATKNDRRWRFIKVDVCPSGVTYRGSGESKSFISL